MRQLIRKEFKLAMHPTSIIFLLLSGMVLIPNYPYYVTFFYTSLGIFFTCLSGRENNDVFYTITLPVRKRDFVKARFAYVVLIELLQVVLTIPFAIFRQNYPLPGNQVGMEPNIAFFGIALMMLSVFHVVFFGIYYKNTDAVGRAFAGASILEFVFMIIAEACTHVIPFMRDKLDTKDPEFMSEKLIVLLAGIAVYVIFTGLAYKKAVKNFEKIDL